MRPFENRVFEQKFTAASSVGRLAMARAAIFQSGGSSETGKVVLEKLLTKLKLENEMTPMHLDVGFWTLFGYTDATMEFS